MKKNEIFRGVATALITPMQDGNIDYPALSKIIEMQIAGGVDALVIGGTTGEAATLDRGEREELYSFAKNRIGKRAKVIFGTGTNDTRAAIEHTRSAERIGCDGVLTVTPYYNKGTFGGVVEHYKRIAGSTSLPIILYNVPQRTGVNLTVSQLEKLAKIENIVGIKEASDSAERLLEVSVFGDELYLYAGNDTAILEVLALGGSGVISVVSNLYPERVRRICDSYFKGYMKNAQNEQKRLLKFTKAMFAETNPAPIKYAMSKAGLCSGELRLPLMEIENSTKEIIDSAMSRL